MVLSVNIVSISHQIASRSSRIFLYFQVFVKLIQYIFMCWGLVTIWKHSWTFSPQFVFNFVSNFALDCTAIKNSLVKKPERILNVTFLWTYYQRSVNNNQNLTIFEKQNKNMFKTVKIKIDQKFTARLANDINIHFYLWNSRFQIWIELKMTLQV